jgi:hypothetical protein
MATGKTKTPPAKTAKGRSTSDEQLIVQVRFPRELVDAIDREAERLSQELGGEPVGRSEALRIIVRRALKTSGK